MSDDAYRRICDEIKLSAVNNGRNPDDIALVAVTKSVELNQILKLYHQGQRLFGESRLSEAYDKQVECPKDCQWHLIGTLQSNKVRKAIGNFQLIHSVDSLELAKKISSVSQEMGKISNILLQANTSGEKSKHGLTPHEWQACFNELLELPSLSINGLMTMAPLDANELTARQCFSNLFKLREILSKKKPLLHLSMGMSRDFKWAIAEGATLVRIGSALFE